MAMSDGDVLEYKDDGYIELVLKIMGLTCDGQNRTLQVSESLCVSPVTARTGRYR